MRGERFCCGCFGATMGPDCHFYPRSKVWAPWNLVCADQVTAADGAEIYNPAPMTLWVARDPVAGRLSCAARRTTMTIRAFPLIAYAMNFGAYAWVCARASVAPGVNVGEGAVLGLGSVATRNLEPWAVYAGVPAVKVKERKRRSQARIQTRLPSSQSDC